MTTRSRKLSGYFQGNRPDIENIDNFHLAPSKLNPPALNSRWVVRPRLLAALDSGLKRKLTLVSAPAGYGKTTVVVQWLHSISSPSVWLSLDEYDSDPDRFLRYVVASIHTVFPQFGGRLNSLLPSPMLPPTEYLADTLIADLAAMAKPLVLVFDDFHSIGSEPVKLVERLIQYLPNKIHIVIVTRVAPLLPLVKWRARGWSTEIGTADLRFYREEAHAYFSSHFAGQLSDAAIEQVTDQAEGWVTGLQLARYSLANAVDPETWARNAHSNDRVVIDFLMDEVFVGQTDAVKHFLLITSVLKSFCAPLGDNLLEAGGRSRDSGSIIAFLEKENLFLVPLDSEGTWYRYHYLFQLFLTRQMKTTLPQSLQRKIHLHAGEWFAEQGYIDEGLNHLIIAGDLDGAAELIGANMHAAVDQDNHRRILNQWLEMFPDDAERNRPTLLVAQAYVKMIRWDITGIVQLIDRAEMLLQEPGCMTHEMRRQSLMADMEILRAICLYWKGDAKGALHHAQEFMRRGRSVKGQYAHTLAVSYAAGAHALCGQTDDALLLVEDALAADCKEGSANTAHLLIVKVVIHYYQVNFAEVEKNVKRALTVHKSVPQPDYWLGYVPYFLGSIAYERNALEVAKDYFGRIAEQMRYRVNTRLYHDALFGLALIAWAAGDADGAEKYADLALSFAIEAKDPLSMYISDLIRLRLAILAGDASVEPVPSRPVVDSNQFWLETPSLIHAEYLFNRGGQKHCEEGLASVERGLRMVREHHNLRLVIQFLAVKAVGLKCAGKKDQALELLEESLRLAEPHGLVRSFINRGPLMAELLHDLSLKHPRNQYLKTLVEASGNTISSNRPIRDASGIPPSPNILSSRSSVAADLTNRELDILILLRKRLTNKEIARKLGISPITVKSHSIKIYRKLKVHGRRQAVDRAERLGLVSD